MGLLGFLIPLICSIAVLALLGEAIFDEYFTAEDVGIYSIISAVSWVGVLAGIVGIILSAIGIKQLKSANQSAGMAIAGLIISIIAIVFALSCSACHCLACIGFNETVGPGFDWW